MGSFIGDVTNVLSQGAGMMSPLGAIAGGVSALGSLFGKDNSMALAEKQHQWDVEENEKNRQFQAEQWQHQFDETNRYNSPKETAKRLREGGLNANAILNGQGSAIGQSSASPSAPSGASGLNPMPDVVSQVGWQSKESLMKRLSLLGDLSKNSYLLPETKQKLSADIQNTLADERFKQVRADAESYMLQLDKFFKPIERQAGVASALSNMALAVAETKLALANGEVANVNKLKIAEERLLTIAKRNLSEKDLERLKIELKWLDKEHEQSIKESKSRESANYASAEESRSNAEQTKFFNKINNDPNVRHSIMQQAIEAGKAAEKANAISDKNIQLLNHAISQAIYADDMKEFTYWSNQIQSIVGTIGEAASSFYGAGALRELIQLRKLQGSGPVPVRGFSQ